MSSSLTSRSLATQDLERESHLQPSLRSGPLKGLVSPEMMVSLPRWEMMTLPRADGISFPPRAAMTQIWTRPSDRWGPPSLSGTRSTHRCDRTRGWTWAFWPWAARRHQNLIRTAPSDPSRPPHYKGFEAENHSRSTAWCSTLGRMSSSSSRRNHLECR